MYENSAVTETKNIPIRSRTNNSWELLSSNPNDPNSLLDLTYLDNDILCSLSSSDGANRHHLQFSLVCKRSDFVALESDASPTRLIRGAKMRQNKQRVIAAVLTKTLSGACQQPNKREVIELSRVKFEEE